MVKVCWQHWSLLLLLRTSVCLAEDEGYEFVQQVLQDDDHQQFNAPSSTLDDDAYEQMLRNEEQRRQQEHQQQERYRLEQQKFVEEQKNLRIQQERERHFQAQLTKLTEDQRKLALKQKKRDAAIVNRVLKSKEKDDPYAALGLPNNHSFRLPERFITVIPRFFTLHVPEIQLFAVNAQQIKRAYRERAKLVHPDKNVDGRAVEAFVAVEEAAAILLDEVARAQYDQQILQQRRDRRSKVTGVVWKAFHKALGTTSRVLGTIKMLLGPFAVPFLILAALIF